MENKIIKTAFNKLKFSEVNKLKKGSTRKTIIYSIWTSILLFVCFILCRYFFYTLHGMASWPFYLFIFGIVVIIVATFFASRKIMICTPIGYIIGFAFGMFFNTDSPDPGGGRLNNAWIIWTVTFLILITIGVVLELITRKIKRK